MKARSKLTPSLLPPPHHFPTITVITDTGRNGVPDTRSTCSSWCNIRGAGIGQLPRATALPDPRLDALYWLKTPGESDGCTEVLPDGNRCPRFDSNCAGIDSIGTRAGEPRAPEAGQWFLWQVRMNGN